MNLQIYDVVKEVDILKKQRSIYLRSRLILIVLFLTLSITIIISVLAFRLRSSNIILEKLTKNRDKLFTIISHDLRSPLNSYQRYAEIVAYLIKTKQFDRLDEALKKIDEIGLNLAALLNNLLDWSLFKQIPNTSIINIQVFFNELLPIYRDMANLKGLVLVETFQDKVVRADPHLLSLITRNLLDNAIKYTHVNNEVIIGTHRDDNDLILMVSNREDSMSDIQKEKISALFNNNYDYEFGEEGLGIGLILIKEFAQSQNIKITFYHNPDNLTTFEVRILQAFV
ncbi:sensor histidine kinase [Emticicia sp. SJ17W-69]|uniref:sensor histidine kinase n=1 Tax=Emticicia sp. SJ17W-69 TaxID=3421657 RepID=UPI003EB9F8CF